MIDFYENLKCVRQNFAKEKRSCKPLPKTHWMTTKDSLSKTYTEYLSLMRHGEIHYACTIQANEILFRSHPAYNCPADILFSTDEYFDRNPFDLIEMANELYSYKNCSDAPSDIKHLTDAITDEYERFYNVLLPDSMTSLKVYCTTMQVFRKHLPKKRLIGRILPVITSPDTLQTTLVVPKKYWTKELVQLYVNS